ncbi:DUF6412 domain-containing protein [Actinomadura sp. DC4]|uniref:DUF6412 domain-containing protein n=1 Tax=Actinomadura sp. DC4 TaxID=3055069 RepID=UPI0025B1689A|nr:DUF6412 domain-containing protein [Actinomadura sp. DC4]MDN3355319.1 DUF6412 domain-containing protein [Actinomadura sp. DC4]
MTRILAVAVTALIAGWTAADALTPSAFLLAAAALAVAALVVLAARRPDVISLTSARSAVVDASRAVVIRLCDPGAAGRPRPRAPSALLRAAE